MTTTLIFGGTFDPVHFGHLRSARALLKLFHDARLVMIPCQIPSHRDQPVAEGKHRLNMLNMAVEDEKSITVDDCELERTGTSYTYDTLQNFRKRYPDSDIYFVMGTDAWLTLTTWYFWKELINYSHLLVLARPGNYDSESPILEAWAEPRILEFDQVSAKAGNVVKLTLTQMEISATLIRKALSKGESIAEWVPDDVIEYIQKNRLYRDFNDRT